MDAALTITSSKKQKKKIKVSTVIIYVGQY